MGEYKHGHTKRSHERRSREYVAWAGMHTRCTNSNVRNYEKYGGRGIKVCERWKDFVAFLADMGPCPSAQHSIDRFPNNDGNYEPGNCRWATRAEQAMNRRSNHLLTHEGRTMTLTEWAIEKGMPSKTLYSRIYRGVPTDKALSIPVGQIRGALL